MRLGGETPILIGVRRWRASGGFDADVMSLFKLKSDFLPTGDQPQAIERLVSGIKKGNDYQTLLGVTGSGKTFTMANVISQLDRPVLVIAPNKSLAAQLYSEYKSFFPENSVNYFVSYYDYYQPEAYMPITDTYIEKEAMINEEIDRLRHQATSALLTRKDVIVVASVSCIYNLGVPENYLETALYLEVGQSMTRADLIKRLVKIQFIRNDTELKRGSFRVRGDLFEIIPASGSEMAFQIELGWRPDAPTGVGERGLATLEAAAAAAGGGSKVQKIFLIDKLKRQRLEEMKDVLLFPPKHFITASKEIERALKDIKVELKERLSYFKKKKLYLEAERLERRTRYDMEMIKTLGYCHGIENYSRHLSGKQPGEAPDTLMSYFPKVNGKPHFLTIIDESHIAVPQVRGMYAGDQSRKQTLIQYGWRLPSALDNRPMKFAEFVKMQDKVIFTSATPGEWEEEKSTQVVEQVIRPTGLVDPTIEVRPVFDVEKNRSQVDDVISEIEKAVAAGERTLVTTLTKKMAEELTTYLSEKKIKVSYIHSDVLTFERGKIMNDLRRGDIDVLVGVNLLREGLDFPEVGLVAILDADREGFLRNETSLIQTMGRAARNVNGRVILYADKMTDSIKNAMSVVNRRREIQLAYNEKHGITAQTIVKDIKGFWD